MTKVILPQSSTVEDWAAFYADLEKKANIPNASSVTNHAGKVIFRNTYLNLKKVKEKVAKMEGVVHVVLFTDTLEIPEFTKWVIQHTSLIIYARNIIIQEGASILIDYQNSLAAKLIVTGRELNGTIETKCVFNTNDSPDIFHLNETVIKSGIIVSAKNNKATLGKLALADVTELFPKEDLSYYLNNAFIYASLLYDLDQQMAVSMLLWVKLLSSQSSDFKNLFYRSTSLASLLQSQINAKENGARFVPHLSATVYENLAGAFTTTATQFESNYLTLSTQDALTVQNIEVAKTMIETTESEIDFVNALLDQAKQNSEAATNAVNEAIKNFENQNAIVELVAIDFEIIGIPEYKRKVILEGALDIVSSLIAFGTSIALMATGAGAGAGAVGAGTSIASVTKVAKSGVETASMAKTLVETMEKLVELIEVIGDAVVIAQSINQVVNDLTSAERQMSTIQEMNDFYDNVAISSADNWSIFQLQASNAMVDPIDLGIRFAKEYEEAMQILAIYGQSLSAAQSASMKADQELASIFFQLQYTQEKKESLEKLVKTLEVGQEANLELMQQFYQKYLDSKSSLFAALTSYKQSFFYWSFSESLLEPQIIDPVNQLNSGLDDLTQITMDKASALERFNPPPQEMKNMLFSVADKVTINMLKNEKEANWVLPLNDPEFLGLERIRLDSIRVWIEGVKFKNKEDSVSVTITNTGNYLDCYKGLGYQFNSKKLIRSFRYKIMDSPLNANWKFDNNTWGLVQLDGKVDQEVKYAYFRPTPFSEWKISLKSNNQGIDLSGVSKITMYFEGTAIGSTPEYARRLTEKAKLDVST